MSNRTKSVLAYEPWELRAHEKHVFLLKRCSLCQRDAGAQTDRLMTDEQVDALLMAEDARTQAARQ